MNTNHRSESPFTRDGAWPANLRPSKCPARTGSESGTAARFSRRPSGFSAQRLPWDDGRGDRQGGGICGRHDLQVLQGQGGASTAQSLRHCFSGSCGQCEETVLSIDDPEEAIAALIELRLTHSDEHRQFLRVFFETNPRQPDGPGSVPSPSVVGMYDGYIEAVRLLFQRGIAQRTFDRPTRCTSRCVWKESSMPSWRTGRGTSPSSRWRCVQRR